MSVVVMVDTLTFTFPAGWAAAKFDDSNFYRNQFSRQFNGIKAVDLLALSPEGTAYFIEAKDYRHPSTIKPSDLADSIAKKVLMTLAALLPAKHRATDPLEKSFAAGILGCLDYKVIAHLEVPRVDRLGIDPANIQMKLQQRLRAVDCHVKVVGSGKMRALAWHVD